MAEQYRFFGSTAGDTRQYNQIEFAEVFSRIFKNGYFPEVGNELQVTSTDPAGMTVEVKSGQAWINGYWYKNDSNKVLTINAADATLNRIDRVVLRLDVVMNRVIEALIIQGTPASNPAAPALTRTSQIYEISLAQIYVAAGVTSISQSAITDERDDINVCGKAVPYYVPNNDDIVTVPQANKILRLNAQGKLPASITGDADTLDNYHASDFYRFVAKRDANGNIIYTLEASNLSEEKHNKGLQYENASGTGEFNMRLIVSPSYKKRFLKITFDMWEEQANFDFSLVNVNTGEILHTTSLYSSYAWQEAVFTTDSIVINPGASVTFKIIYNWYRSYKYGDIVIGGIRNLRAYMEDMELK